MKYNEDISNLYSILYQKESWYNRKSIQNRQLDAIKKLGFYGDAQSIHALVRFLNHNSNEMRSATIKSIKNLFRRFDSKSAYETSLRHCDILKEDIRDYVSNYEGEELKYPLAIASINNNGYVREEALNQIFENDLSEALLQFVIYRLGDWVSQVRVSAERNFNQVLKKGTWKTIINHLDLIFWLKKVQRVDLSGIYDETIQFLTIENSGRPIRYFLN